MASLSLFVLLVCAAELFPASAVMNNVEIYFVVDSQVVQKYMAVSSESDAAAKRAQALVDIENDADYFITEANQIFASMAENGLNIKISKRKLTILETNVFGSSVAEREVDAALATFDSWLDSEGAYSTLNYDLALLWTGFDLHDDGSTSTTGYAHVGTVCGGARASSIVENDGTYHTVAVTAHEIAHNLGASHDGSATGFVMAPTAYADSVNRWKFSVCTASDVKATIDLLETNCLLTTDGATTTPSATVPADLRDPDVICSRGLESTNTYMCKSKNLYDNAPPQGDAVCRQLYCRNPTNPGYCSSVFSSDGLPCGTNMICNDGVCVADASGGTADLDPNCLFGDVGEISMTINGSPFTGSCTQLLSQYSTMCSNSFVSEQCCSSCAGGGSSSSGGGDTGSTGSTGTSGCSTADVTTLSLTVNGDPFSGTCEEFIAQYDSGMCYYDVVSTPCCVACSAYATDIPNCEYGDQYPGFCSGIPTSMCSSYAQYCCETCNGQSGRRRRRSLLRRNGPPPPNTPDVQGPSNPHVQVQQDKKTPENRNEDVVNES